MSCLKLTISLSSQYAAENTQKLPLQSKVFIYVLQAEGKLKCMQGSNFFPITKVTMMCQFTALVGNEGAQGKCLHTLSGLL